MFNFICKLFSGETWNRCLTGSKFPVGGADFTEHGTVEQWASLIDAFKCGPTHSTDTWWPMFIHLSNYGISTSLKIHPSPDQPAGYRASFCLNRKLLRSKAIAPSAEEAQYKAFDGLFTFLGSLANLEVDFSCHKNDNNIPKVKLIEQLAAMHCQVLRLTDSGPEQTLNRAWASIELFHVCKVTKVSVNNLAEAKETAAEEMFVYLFALSQAAALKNSKCRRHQKYLNGSWRQVKEMPLQIREDKKPANNGDICLENKMENDGLANETNGRSGIGDKLQLECTSLLSMHIYDSLVDVPQGSTFYN